MTSTVDLLIEWSATAVLREMLRVLDDHGIVTDEDSTALTSTAIEQWTPECEDYVRGQGYEGGAVEVVAKHYHGCGSVYALYDAHRHT